MKSDITTENNYNETIKKIIDLSLTNLKLTPSFNLYFIYK